MTNIKHKEIFYNALQIAVSCLHSLRPYSLESFLQYTVCVPPINLQFVFYTKDKLRVRVFRTNFLTYFGQNLTGHKNKFVQRQIAENLDVFDVFLSEMKYAVFRARF